MNKLLFLGKGLLLLCLFATQLVTAQTVSTDYATQINSTFANLDKTRIPHKLLVDYAMEFEELSNFNGVLTNNNITNKGTYIGIYNTLLMARVNANITGLVNPTIFKNNWDNLRQTNKIVLSGLYYKYNEFKPNAPNNTITITNGKLYDKFVGGIWQNPYDEKQVFAVTAPIVKYNSLSMQVQLPTALWYSNQANNVQSIAIDFNDGLGYQSVTFDQIKNVAYTTAGLKEWKYKLTLTNNQILYSHSKIQIDAEIPPVVTSVFRRTITQPCSQNAFGVDEVDFNGTRQYVGTSNQAILEIDYALNDCVIRKPLIVVEGYDSGLLGVENPLGEVDYRQFRYNSIPYGGTNLIGQINTYDIIYINFKKGNDYMQRNAYLVEDVIKWVNSVKQGSLPNVVLGQSMGGVIARYALRDMENQLASTGNQTWNHKTNLYISHDAPHQGANMPLSIQYFARHLIDQFVSTPLGDMNINLSGSGGAVTISDLETLLNQPGTKQLLNNYVASGFNIDNIVGNAWRTELQNMGYPQQTRNIALSNGSHCANPQNFNPNDNLFTFNGRGQTKLLTDLILFINPLFINQISSISLAILFNEPGLLIGMLPGNSKFELDFWGNALPTAGATNQIYHGNVRFTKTLFKLFGWTPRITVTLTNRDYSAPGGLSYDYYPGGKYQSFISGGGTSVSNVFGSFGIQMSARDNFNFIPTPSALDIGNGSVALNNADFFTKYNSATPPVAPKNSPFINFSTSFNTSGTNENHISFNTRNGNWLALELDSNATNNDNFNCSYMCANTQITGSAFLCTSATYTVPSGGTFNNWTITQGASLVTLTGNGTPNVTLTALPDASGAVTLSLTMGDDPLNNNSGKCGNVTITKNIWVGVPIYSSFVPIGNQTGYNPLEPNLSVSEGGGCNQSRFRIVFNSPSILEYQWEKLSTSSVFMPASTTTNQLTLTPQCNELLTFRVRARNICGWSEWKQFDYSLNRCTMDCYVPPSTTLIGDNFILNPNPLTDGLLNISLKYGAPWFSVIVPGLTDSDGQPVTTFIINIRVNISIFNQSGGLMQSFNNSTMPAQLNLSTLSQGTYIVMFEYQGQTESYTIIKN
jgi:hypothetical protein